MTRKALGFSFLTDVDLGNHNAGEGGSQLADLKKYGNRPYISGQAYRRAMKEALREQIDDPQKANCSSRYPCGEIEECLICDIFGYMNTDEFDANDDETPQVKRPAPLRVSKLLGQYERPKTTDMILQEDQSEAADNRIGYREIAQNVYHGGVMLDVSAVGRREETTVDESEDHDEIFDREFNDKIKSDERANRVNALVHSVRSASNLAGQARHMADFMPDLVVGATLPEYNQRIQNALNLDTETETLVIPQLEHVIADITALDGDVWIAGTENPDVIGNWKDVLAAADDAGAMVTESVTGCFNAVADHAVDSPADARN
jgi:CRISPR-associated protein Cas7/Cst2/DevR subtype I-B